MSGVNISSGAVKTTGSGGCVGGAPEPNPPIHDFPLLVWSDGQVRTEDGRTTVRDIARAYPDDPRIGTLAARFGTSHSHIAQAVQYAVKAGLLD